MSLRDSYFNGASGLQQQMDAAFQSGIAYVGSGVSDLSTIDLNDRNGSNLGAGSTNPGLYFICSTPNVKYAVWFYVAGEIAPTVSGAVTLQVTILSGDSASQVAAKAAAALAAIGGSPFDATSLADVISIDNNVAGVALATVSVGTLGGTAAAAQVRAGVNPTGNYATLQSALLSAATQGVLKFCVLVQGTPGTINASYLRAHNGNNLLLKSFFAGIIAGLAAENIYSYQVRLQLDVSDQVNTNVLFHFHFGDDCNKQGCGYPILNTNIPHNCINQPGMGQGYYGFINDEFI
jgi:hypothetical protein